LADEIKDAKDGLVTLLGAISGTRAIDYLPEDWNEFPVVLVLFTGRNYQVTMGGSSFDGTMDIWLLVDKQNTKEAVDLLDEYMTPLGTKSVEVAMDADRTWGANIDDGQLISVGDIGYQEVFGGNYMACRFRAEFVKSVST
jgi:hypothetical protein